MERTLAIVKPDGFERWAEIKSDILAEGFQIAEERSALLTKQECSDFYVEHFSKPFFNDLVDYMTSGQVVIVVLARSRAIGYWRKIIGPTDVIRAKAEEPNSLRAKYGTTKSKNALHGSDSFVSAEREINFFFPDIEPTSTTDQVKTYLATEINPILLKGLTELCKVQPEQPVVKR